MNESINGVRKPYLPKPGCASNKGIDSAAKGFDEKAVRQSHSLQGIYGYFRRKRECPTGNLHCGPKKVAPSRRKHFPRGFVVLQVGAVNFVSDLQVCTPNNDIFPTEKPWSPPDFGEVGRVGCGYSCDFLLPMVWFHSRRHAENHRLKNRSAYSNERGIPYL